MTVWQLTPSKQDKPEHCTLPCWCVRIRAGLRRAVTVAQNSVSLTIYIDTICRCGQPVSWLSLSPPLTNISISFKCMFVSVLNKWDWPVFVLFSPTSQGGLAEQVTNTGKPVFNKIVC